MNFDEKAGEMSVAGQIVRVDPAAGLPGGEVLIECSGYDTSNLRGCYPLFGAFIGQTVGLSAKRVLAIVPDAGLDGETEVLLSSDGTLSAPARFIVGRRLAEDLHPVANPAFDPDDGSLFVTRSGSRGQQMPVSIFRVDSRGELDAFSGDITNPTGIAFDPAGQMYVSSRLDGTVYRISHFKEPVAFVQNLGVATGIAFDAEGRLYVGDRTGTIYRVNGIGEERAFAQLEPSVSAYHLAFGPDHQLYVTGPTVSSYDSVMRINDNGDVSVFYRGLGRPQGLAFDREGNLYVAASFRGRRGIVRISPDGERAAMAVAGMNVIGLAFSATGEMAVVTTDAVYSLPLGIYGTLLK